MKQRILSGWTIQRALFLIIGIVILVQSVMQKQWIGVGVGAYFAAMGLFSFGCAAAGGCYGGACNTDSQTKNNISTQDVEYEELKQK